MASITHKDEPDNVEDEVTDKFTRTVDAPPPPFELHLTGQVGGL